VAISCKGQEYVAGNGNGRPSEDRRRHKAPTTGGEGPAADPHRNIHRVNPTGLRVIPDDMQTASYDTSAHELSEKTGCTSVEGNSGSVHPGRHGVICISNRYVYILIYIY